MGELVSARSGRWPLGSSKLALMGQSSIGVESLWFVPHVRRSRRACPVRKEGTEDAKRLTGGFSEVGWNSATAKHAVFSSSVETLARRGRNELSCYRR